MQRMRKKRQVENHVPKIRKGSTRDEQEDTATSSADLRDLADEARSREKDSYLHSERAPVVTSDPTGRTVSTCRAFRSDGKETSPKEPNKQIVAAKSNSSEGAEEATHAKLHLTRSNESKWR
ncbi:hypothetical protein KFK09_021155 [Dendrobium nobile]|uniref:Uncharacterized protein n=1 Tax=Dendrobium nobile TaxID=94219 RepID=A0A8T3AP02_DENNO|nr:hypothetical protein KFK09_021155 [Dendrobium nobile]